LSSSSLSSSSDEVSMFPSPLAKSGPLPRP
jgi:hypothetical protein